MLTSFRRAAAALRLIKRALNGEAEAWEAAGDNARYQFWSGDQFFDDPTETVVYQVRTIPRAYFLEAKADQPERMHPLIRYPERRLRAL